MMLLVNYFNSFSEIAREHDRKLVEDSFADFEKELIVSESKMKAIFGKYGWK